MPIGMGNHDCFKSIQQHEKESKTVKLNGKYFLAFIKSGLFLAFSVGFMSLGCKIFSLLHSKYSPSFFIISHILWDFCV